MAKIASKLAITILFLAGATLHVLYPKLTVDLIDLVCLAGAPMPWLLPLILPRLRALKGKLPRFKTGTVGTKGIEVQFEAAVPEPPAVPTASVIDALAAEALQTLAGFKAGAGTLDAMVNLAVKVEGTSRSMSVHVIAQLLNNEGAGSRLIAYIRLQRVPDPSFAAALARALATEDSVFAQWWCIQALRRLQTLAPQALTQDDLRRLKAHQKKLPRRSDRRSELRCVIDEADRGRSGKPADSRTADAPDTVERR